MDTPDEFRFGMANGDEIVFSRREGLRYALSGFLTFTSVPALAAVEPPVEPPIDPPVDPDAPAGAVSVLSHGAKGDGKTDDTKAIQAALDSGKPHVHLPGGKTYLVRGGGKGTTTDPDCPLNVRSGTTVWASGATVKLAPSQREFTSIVRLNKAEGVTFRGGRFDGSKDQQSPATDKGQDGGLHGFSVDGGARIAFYDVTVTDCFSDGWLLRHGVTDVMMEAPKGLNCRRQGISIIAVNRLVCRHFKFSGTGGQLPEAGIDIEPDNVNQPNSNMLFEDGELSNNAGAGFMFHTKAPLNGLIVRRVKFRGNRRGDRVDIGLRGMGATIDDVLFEDCDIERRVELYGKPASTWKRFRFINNRLRGPHAAIMAFGFTPTGNSVEITGNNIASSSSDPIQGDQPGVKIGGNTIARLA